MFYWYSTFTGSLLLFLLDFYYVFNILVLVIVMVCCRFLCCFPRFPLFSYAMFFNGRRVQRPVSVVYDRGLERSCVMTPVESSAIEVVDVDAVSSVVGGVEPYVAVEHASMPMRTRGTPRTRRQTRLPAPPMESRTTPTGSRPESRPP